MAAFAVARELRSAFHRHPGRACHLHTASSAASRSRATPGITVVDDYGHHPTEIRATLEAARRLWNGRLMVVFQPHRYTRTRALYKEFLTAFPERTRSSSWTSTPPASRPSRGSAPSTSSRGLKPWGTRMRSDIPSADRIVSYLLADGPSGRRDHHPGRRQRLEGGNGVSEEGKRGEGRPLRGWEGSLHTASAASLLLLCLLQKLRSHLPDAAGALGDDHVARTGRLRR